MTKKKSDELYKENARIHANTMKHIKEEAEKRKERDTRYINDRR